ncbi:MAG: RNA polymerase sigma factor [Chloroflexi bacterium]|nr:RNA polymerase sigma factor [Chloroflexota bacterium]
MAGELPPIERLKAQDHAAFAAVVEQHYGAVHRYLARLLGDPDAAAELVQETFLGAYRGLPRLADDSNVGGWLFRIATNLARQHHRHRRRIGWSDVSHLEMRPATSARFEDEVAQQDLIRHALERLPLDERICLLLYAWSGYTCAEIGEVLGRSPDAVRMLLVRARRRFRAAYGARLDWIDDEASGSDQQGAPPPGGSAHSGAPRGNRCPGHKVSTVEHSTARTARDEIPSASH